MEAFLAVLGTSAFDSASRLYPLFVVPSPVSPPPSPLPPPHNNRGADSPPSAAAGRIDRWDRQAGRGVWMVSCCFSSPAGAGVLIPGGVPEAGHVHGVPGEALRVDAQVVEHVPVEAVVVPHLLRAWGPTATSTTAR